MNPGMLSKRSLPDFAWVFVFALAVRLLVLSRFGDSAYFLPTSEDMKFYADWARRIASGNLTDHRAFYGLPGYPFFLGGIFALVGFDPFAVGVLQALSEAAIAALLFQIAAWAFPGPRARAIGGLAALGWTFFQPAQAFSVILMPTTWAVLTFWGIFCWSARTESRSPWRPWLGMGLLTGLVATMVATVFFVLPIPIAAAVRNLRKPGAIVAAAVCLLGGVFLGTSPCWVHNYFVAGEPVFLSAHSGLNFWVGNNPVANGYPKLPPGLRTSQDGMLKDSIRLAEAAAGHPLPRAEVSRYWSAKASAYIHEHPREWLRLMAAKIKNLWNAAQYDDLSIITPLREEGVITPGLRFGWVAGLALPGLFLAWRRSPRSRWIAAAVCLHMAALLPVFVTERYRLAAVPGLLLLAAYGLSALQEALFSRRLRDAGVWLGAGAAAYLFVTLPQHESSLLWLDTYNSGLKALETDNLPRARAKLEHALAFVPENAEVNASLGNYWLHVSDFPRAKWFYQRALRLDPKTLGALNNLALIEMTESHFAVAKELLAVALQIEPDDAHLVELMGICESKLQVPPSQAKP
ncbi:MAG: hypothetical protein NTZ46_02390 [Verrucomicrobia bacterium]|nr:hypothetical protein [Verrucomicrobiota bacterium]